MRLATPPTDEERARVYLSDRWQAGVYLADVQRLTALLAEVRADERRICALEFGEKALRHGETVRALTEQVWALERGER